MRSLGLIGLVLALVIVGVLVKRQLGGVAGMPASPDGQAPSSQPLQPQQVQQQFKQSLDAAMQQARSVPDDAK